MKSPTWTDLWGPPNTDDNGNAPPGEINDDGEIHFIEKCNVEYECDARARSMICGRSARVSFISITSGLSGLLIDYYLQCFQEPVIQNGTNTNSTSCACMTGYQNDEDSGDCVDINECELGTHKCVDNICYNLGSF